MCRVAPLCCLGLGGPLVMQCKPDNSVPGDLRRELTLPGLRLSGGNLGADCLHSFARSSGALPAIRRCVNQLFQAGGVVRSIAGSNLAEQRLHFREDANVLAVTLVEKLQADRAI